jgi:enoyl-CoA hydratase/carnithine racemase
MNPLSGNPLFQKAVDEMASELGLSDRELESLCQRIQTFPHASAMLLQLLSYNESSSDEYALLAESFAYGVLQTGDEFRHWLHSRPSAPSSSAVPVSTDPVSTDRESADPEPLLNLLRQDNVLRVCLSRPAARNAYSAAMRDALYEALQLLDLDHSIEQLQLSGEGECFCVGGDLAEFGQSIDSAQAYRIRRERNVAALLLKNRHRIVARVHRACIGSGIELPACAGTVIATQNTFFQLPELEMGLLPGAGGTVGILRRIGRIRLAWWILSGKRINSQTALDWGLIDEITEPD